MKTLEGFFEPSKHYDSKAAQIEQTIRGWDYIPSPRAISEGFGIHYNTAHKIYKSVLMDAIREHRYGGYKVGTLLYSQECFKRIRNARMSLRFENFIRGMFVPRILKLWCERVITIA